jgi:hypothetical protein
MITVSEVCAYPPFAWRNVAGRPKWPMTLASNRVSALI